MAVPTRAQSDAGLDEISSTAEAAEANRAAQGEEQSHGKYVHVVDTLQADE